MRTNSGLLGLLFPRGVRVWHFIAVPAVTMAILIVVARQVDYVAIPLILAHDIQGVYMSARSVVIGLVMSGVIAVLAYAYRSDYEAKLQARNRMLEATRDFLTRIIEGAAEAIITRDAEGKVTSWNPAAEAIYGWSAEEMLGRTAEVLISPDDPGARADYEKMRILVEAGTSVRDWESRRIRKDGKPITVSVTMAPIYDSFGRYAGSTGIVRDVTAIKEMEARLLEQERLAAVGELAAIVAHEVRNPLAGIRGACEILLEGYRADDARTEIGREVLHQVDRLNGTVTDLLLYARPKAMDPVPTDFHALLDRVLNVLREEAEARGIAIERVLDPDPPVVVADGRQLEQVLINLLQNAFHVVPEDGRVRIETSHGNGALVASIEDNGPGIPPDRLERIFKPFYTTRTQGTGLGLAICKKIVDAHGGRIDVVSPSGSGARFTITLPLDGPRTE
jgi:two-component system nitrogen regulation sensor histidine kinase GlnL